MDAILDAQFQGVETALNTLIESISSYNPSVQAGQDLWAANEDLERGLAQVATHRANTERIYTLRQAADALDNQIKSTLRSLAKIRKELLATPATVFPPSSRKVPFDELLSYAKFISKFTMPPTLRDASPKETEETTEDTQAKIANGITQSPVPQSAVEPKKEKDQDADAEKDKNVPQEMRDFLASVSNAPWEPWPSSDQIRGGNLFAIQMMVDSGQDPSNVLSPEEQAAEDKRRAEEEEKARKEREERDAADRARRETMWQQQQQQAAKQEKPAADTFDDGGLDLYDPDDE